MLAEEKLEVNKNFSAVLDPVIFLDIFDYPPTAYEISYYLDSKFPLAEVVLALEELVVKGVIQENQGFYFLPNRQEIIGIRQARYNYSCAKLKIARRFSRLFSWFPGVIAVAAANFIGRHNLRLGSDIDFFVITKPGKIWLSRLYCAGLAKILNRRPTNRKKKDKICLSFYIAADQLDISVLALPTEDPYFYYWQRGLVPLYNYQNTWENFLQANKLSASPGITESTNNIHSVKMSRGEKLAKKLQLKIMSPALLAARENSDGVVITDSVLKLYLGDRRRYFTSIFKDKKHEIFTTLN